MASRSSSAPRSVPGFGEKALMRAVLVDAIDCLTGERAPSRAHLQQAADARAWVAARDSRWPFSFDSICAALDLDADRVRNRLLDATIAVTPASAAPQRVREEDVVAMIRDGHPLREVAAHFGISMPKASTLSRGLASRLKAERDVHIHALRRSGWTVSELSSHFKLSHFRVRRICARAERSSRPGAGRGQTPRESSPLMIALGGTPRAR